MPAQWGNRHLRRVLLRETTHLCVESVLLPLGWDRTDIRQWFADSTDATLAAYSG